MKLTPTRALVGFDGSGTAVSAVLVASRLFPGADVTIVNVWQPPGGLAEIRRIATGSVGVEDLMVRLEAEGSRHAAEVLRAALAVVHEAGWTDDLLPVRGIVAVGLELARIAESRDPDVVVVGSRALGGVDGLLGSTADLLVHRSPRPVLVVPAPEPASGHDAGGQGPVLARTSSGPVVIGWDGSSGARAAMVSAAYLWPERELVVASVGQVREDCRLPEVVLTGDPRPRVVELAPGRGPTTSRRNADALSACARDSGAAVIVCGSRGRSAVAEMVVGSTAMALLHHAGHPVLVVPHPRSGERTRTES